MVWLRRCWKMIEPDLETAETVHSVHSSGSYSEWVDGMAEIGMSNSEFLGKLWNWFVFIYIPKFQCWWNINNSNAFQILFWQKFRSFDVVSLSLISHSSLTQDFSEENEIKRLSSPDCPLIPHLSFRKQKLAPSENKVSRLREINDVQLSVLTRKTYGRSSSF